MALGVDGITILIETVLQLVYFVLIGYGTAILFRRHRTIPLILLSLMMGLLYAVLFQGGRMIDASLAGLIPDLLLSLLWLFFFLFTILPAAVIVKRGECSWGDAFIGGLYVRAVLLMLSVTLDPFIVGIYLNTLRR